MKYCYRALALLCVAFASHAEITAEDVAADCAKISEYAQQGERFYKAKNYPKAREAFENQVMWQEQCDAIARNVDNDLLATAYNNVALTWIREGEYRKALAWLSIMPENKKSAYNLSLIKEKLAALPKPASAAGEYWQYAGRGTFETLTLKPQDKETFLADWSGYYFGMMAMYYGPNLGEFSEKVTLKAGKGVIKLRDGNISDCTISLNLSPDLLHIKAKTDDPVQCGFGHNVSADGTYRRVN